MRSFPIALQLNSVRSRAAKHHAAVLKRIAGMRFTGVEFDGLYRISAKEWRRLLDGYGLVASSCHGPVPTQQNLAEITDTAKTLGYTWHIVELDRRACTSAQACRNFAGTLQEAAFLLETKDLRLGIHNQWWEFETKFEGKNVHQLCLSSASSAYVEFDAYCAAVGGEDPARIVRALGARVSLLHLKDGRIDRKPAHSAVGAGRMDWGNVVEALNETAMEWLVLDLDESSPDMFKALESSVQYLVGRGYGKAAAHPESARNSRYSSGSAATQRNR